MNRIRFGRRGLVIGVAAVAALAAAGGIAYATIPDGNKVFNACMLNKIGTIRLIDKSLPASDPMSHCSASLGTPISWNQQGQPGPPGPQGLPGSNCAIGPAGPQGSKGDTGPGGPQGPKGDPGADGAQGAKGNTGPAGAGGPQGPRGDTGPIGPAGADGAPGPAGPQGLEGDPGPAGTNGQDGACGVRKLGPHLGNQLVCSGNRVCAPHTRSSPTIRW